MHTLNELLEFAVEATKIAREIIISNLLLAKSVSSQEGHDIKLDGDILSEKAIISYLDEKTGFRMVSEESGDISGRQNDKYWIIDPIDGSLNFSREIPISCISISLWENNAPLLGVINDFNRNEVFSGIVGKGAWLNKQTISVSKTERLENAILATGFPSKTDYSSNALSTFVEKVQMFKKIRLIGSASLSTAYVASGRFDAYMEKGIMLWDVAAGIAITMAAGGEYNIEKAGDEFQYNVIVCNSELIELINS
jgi:myo-inositol-1(or 4)-monophosphatase